MCCKGSCECNCEKEKIISMKGEPMEIGETISITCNCNEENNDFIVKKDIDKNVSI